MSLKKYLPWLLLFFVLLGSIPILLRFDQIVLAKIIGVVTVVSVSVALRVWLVSAKKNASTRIRLNTNDRFWLNDHVPFYAALNKEDQIVFQDRMGLYLKSVYMRTANNEMPERDDCLLVASHYVQNGWNKEFAIPQSYHGVVWGDKPLEGEHEVDLNVLKSHLG